jgi:AraC-like DNA-binding protein
VLLRGDPRGCKVTNIASDLGFTELGRFAVRYRQMFGETPSQTLQRRAQKMVSVPGWRA